MFHTMFHVVLDWDGQRQTIRHNRTMPALRAQFGTSAILGTVNRSKKTGTSRIISFSSDAKSILVGMALVLIGGAMWGVQRHSIETADEQLQRGPAVAGLHT